MVQMESPFIKFLISCPFVGSGGCACLIHCAMQGFDGEVVDFPLLPEMADDALKAMRLPSERWMSLAMKTAHRYRTVKLSLCRRQRSIGQKEIQVGVPCRQALTL